jgi:hypothetical protein
VLWNKFLEKFLLDPVQFPIGPNRFEGEILIESILSLKFVPALRFAQNPSLTIWHKEETGKFLEFTIHFPGLSAKLAGFDAEKIYNLLLNLIKKSISEQII